MKSNQNQVSFRSPFRGKSLERNFLVAILSLCFCTTLFGKQVDVAESAKPSTVSEASASNSGRVRVFTSSKGLKYWILESHLNSLVGVSFAFPGGTDMEVNGKEHVAALATRVMMMGAGDWSESELYELLEDNGISLKMIPGKTDIFGITGLIPTENLELATEAMKKILLKPRVTVENLERAKSEAISSVQQAASSVQGVSAILSDLYADFQYQTEPSPVFEGIKSVRQEDILGYTEAVLRRDQLMAVFVGDIDPSQAGKVVDDLFADLPAGKVEVPKENAVVTRAPPIEFPEKSSLNVFRGLDGPQTTIRLTIPWHAPEDQDYFAARVALEIFGLGGFASRLMDEIRERGGYTYGINSIPKYRLIGNTMEVEYATRNEMVGESLKKVLEVWDNFANEGPTEREVQFAKGFLLGYLPQRLESVTSATEQLVNIQTHKLAGGNANYLESFAAALNSLTTEDVVRATKKWFRKDRVQITIIGQPVGVEGATERSLEEFLEKALR